MHHCCIKISYCLRCRLLVNKWDVIPVNCRYRVLGERQGAFGTRALFFETYVRVICVFYMRQAALGLRACASSGGVDVMHVCCLSAIVHVLTASIRDARSCERDGKDCYKWNSDLFSRHGIRGSYGHQRRMRQRPTADSFRRLSRGYVYGTEFFHAEIKFFQRETTGSKVKLVFYWSKDVSFSILTKTFVVLGCSVAYLFHKSFPP